MVVATQPLHPLYQTQLWIKHGLRDHAVFFTINVNGVNTMIIIENLNFLAQLITEGMRLAMDNYVNHHWLENVLSPLALAVALALYHHIHPHWTLSHHYNYLDPQTPCSVLPFFTPMEAIEANPLFFPWVPISLQVHVFPSTSLSATHGTFVLTRKTCNDRGPRGTLEEFLYRDLHTLSSFPDDISREGGQKICSHLSSGSSKMLVRPSTSGQPKHCKIHNGPNSYASSQLLSTSGESIPSESITFNSSSHVTSH